MRDNSGREVKVNLLDLLLLLSRHRWFLIAFSFSIAAITAAITLVLPKTYTATLVLMPPEDHSGGISKLMKNFPVSKLAGGLGGAAGLISDGKGRNLEDVYMAILYSRTMQEDVIKTFDLAKVYKFDQKKKWFIEDLLKALSENYVAGVNEEGTISIQVDDKDPQRAAAMANYFGAKLDSIYKRLVTETEHNQRVFLEERLVLIKQNLVQAENAYTKFLKDNRMLDVEEQAKASIETGSTIEARYMAAQLRKEMAKRIFNSGNPKIKELEIELNEMDKQRRQLSETRKSDLLIPYLKAPEMGLELFRLKREVKIQEALFELVTQQHEQSKFEESRNTPNVQVLDKAVPPQKRSKPKRTVLVIIAFVGSFAFGTVLILIRQFFLNLATTNPADFNKLIELRRTLLRR